MSVNGGVVAFGIAMREQGGGVAEIIAAKLQEDNVPDQVASLITGALGSSGPEGAAAAGQARVFLKSIAVEGFRGIGPKVTLHLPPGPGLRRRLSSC
jgi:hypothetical protein